MYLSPIIRRGIINAMKAFWIIIICSAVLSGAIWIVFKPATSVDGLQYEHINVVIDGVILGAELADSSAKQVRGLSGRMRLGARDAMLFQFPQERRYGMWMKEMNFAIDIIWIDNNLNVVDFVANATPDTFPHVFEPSLPATYVLETEAGFIKKNGISTSSQISISK